MERLSADTIKKLQLNILADVCKFCQQNDIDYFLAYGSLLGAVRHKGMIPWDDDIDVGMARPDYDRFIALYKPANRYKLLHYTKNGGYLLPFAKVIDTDTVLYENNDFGAELGVNIDIFPIDGIPGNRRKARRFVRGMKLRWGLVASCTIKDSAKRSLPKRVFIRIVKIADSLLRLKKRFAKAAATAATRYDYDSAEYAGCVVWGYGLKEIQPKENFKPTVYASFEHLTLKIPANFDAHLTCLYGDYLKLPPEEERTGRHEIIAYFAHTAQQGPLSAGVSPQAAANTDGAAKL